MTTLRTLITDALRESGIIDVGEDPDADVQAEALRRLQVFIRSLIGQELGDSLMTLSYGTTGLSNTYATTLDYSDVIDASYVPLNSRLVFNNGAAKTLYLHPQPQDGSRLAVIDNRGNLGTYNVVLNGNGRLIEDASSVTLSTNSLKREWFYRADQGSWKRVTDLTVDDENPFPVEFDDLLILSLAIRLNPRYGAETKEETVEALRRARRQFRARYRQDIEMRPEDALIRLTSGYLYDGFDLDANHRFNNGRG